jgi:hypothetical protein
MTLVATCSTLNIGLIDEKSCPNEALEYAASLGASNVKAVKGNTPDCLPAMLKEAAECDVLILDCKLFLDDEISPCFSPEPPEIVDGIAMSKAAKSIYLEAIYKVNIKRSQQVKN